MKMTEKSNLKEELLKYYISINQVNPERNVEMLFNTEPYAGRFIYLEPFLSQEHKKNVLISGCSIGSECIIAKRFGFQEVVGTELNPKYIEIGMKRTINDPSIKIINYDGVNLPYQNNFFSAIISGHIIEHTQNPFMYLKEHFRVLKNNGLFFLEFPNRYHYVELHTNQWSLEFLPEFIRSFGYQIMISSIFPINQRKKDLYRNILESELKQISINMIKKMCKNINPNMKIINISKPLPGYVRIIIQKGFT